MNHHTQSRNSTHAPRGFIFCTSYIAAQEGCLAERYTRWIRYYDKRKALFGAERIFLIDDGSSPKHIPPGLSVVSADGPLPDTLPDGPVMFRFSRRLGRSAVWLYPGWWRSFTFAAKIAKKYGFGKIVHFESDAFVISAGMARYIRQQSLNWTTFWCPRWHFPETSLQVIGGSAVDQLEALHDRGEKFWRGDRGRTGYAEYMLPFTRVQKTFTGDRYGEFMEDYPKDADYVCQATPGMRFDDMLLKDSG